MSKRVLISFLGKTDPFRGFYDGPLLHIIRYYNPEKVYVLCSDEIAKDELPNQYNLRSIEFLSPDCEVDMRLLQDKKVHSFDNFTGELFALCAEVSAKYTDYEILMNVSSGTPQMNSAMCMIAMSDMQRYRPVQVKTPEKAANKNRYFDPKKDPFEEELKWTMENEESENDNRCEEPKLLNFLRPIRQFEVLSLAKNYDYPGAFQLYRQNEDIFSAEVGQLIEHAAKRLRLEERFARKISVDLGREKLFYPIETEPECTLVEYFNCMQIKQLRGELNDFAIRIEVFAEHLGMYILKYCLGVDYKELCEIQQRKSKIVYIMSYAKCEEKLPGIGTHLDACFNKPFEWGKPVNALTIALIAGFLCREEKYAKYKKSVNELERWTNLSTEVRNPVAHTITAITEEKIKAAYGNKDSKALCKSMRTIMTQAFSSRVKSEVLQKHLEIFDSINTLLKTMLEESAWKWN